MLKYLENLVDAIQKEPWAKGISANKDFWLLMKEWMEQHVLSGLLDQVNRQVEGILEIDPELSEPQIFERATRYIVDFLSAHSASIRIYDPYTEQMLSYGSYPSEEDRRKTFIPLEGSIAGEVVKTQRTCLVPNIMKDERYENKSVIHRKGVNSLMAIPLEITRFYPRERSTAGVIQIYFEEKDRDFTPLEIKVANVLASRLSFVIARKKILTLHKTNEKKEAIVGHIFRALGKSGGVKMKQIFDSVIPELADTVNLQSCALFSISKDLDEVVLEAGYPQEGGYHSIGKNFKVDSEQGFNILLNLREYSGSSIYEIVTPSYVLVVDPQKSSLISEGLKQFAARHNINSILYIPLSIDGEISHFMTFDAIAQRQRYTDDEIEIFLFLGRELMKAQKIEQLDDALHDFKNPAIATAGFARRLKALIEEKDSDDIKGQIKRYVNILEEETTRLQELVLSIYRVGKKEVVNLTDVLKNRFEINKEAIKEQLKKNIELKLGPFDHELRVRCYLLHLERIFDNLLNNATNAIPTKGGVLAIGTYRDGKWACAEITNTGQITEEDRLRILEGEGQGRGFYIIHRIIRMLDGKIEITGDKDDNTTIVVRLPAYKGKKKK
jgi:signal transduction histidine kinase